MQSMLSKYNNYFTIVVFFFFMSASLQAVSLELNNFNSEDQTVDVLYNFEGDVAGFQFDVTGLTLSGAAGGNAEAQ